MNEVTVNYFRARLKDEVDQCVENHDVLKVTRRRGEDFVVLSASDWSAIEETLFLERIPGMVDSIKKAAKESLAKGKILKDLKW